MEFQQKIDRMSGANARLLEDKIRQYYGAASTEGAEEEAFPSAPGHVSTSSLQSLIWASDTFEL